MGQSAQADSAHELGADFLSLKVPDWKTGKSVEEETDLAGSLFFGQPVGDAVLNYVKQHAPDALVVDCLLTSGLAAAERSNVPSVALVHVLYQQLVAGTMSQMWNSMLPMINETRSRIGVAPVDSPAAVMHLLNVVLVACPRDFDVALPELPGNVHYVGAIFDDAPTPFARSPSRAENRRPRILVALVRRFSIRRKYCVESLRPWQSFRLRPLSPWGLPWNLTCSLLHRTLRFRNMFPTVACSLKVHSSLPTRA
jgi:hypothetical protein